MSGMTRRDLLKFSTAALLAAPLAPTQAANAETRHLSLVHTHVNESLSIDYFSGGAYVPEALAALHHLLRDFRTGEEHPIDPALFDLLYDLKALTQTSVPYDTDWRQEMVPVFVKRAVLEAGAGGRG